MLCSVELGQAVGRKKSQEHYWVVADTLILACAKAIRQAQKDHGEQASDWTILEAQIKSVDDPVS